MGGHNRSHGCTSRYRQLDSFLFIKPLSTMRERGIERVECEMGLPDGDKLKAFLYADRLEYNRGERLHFSFVSNNYGGQPRIYFTCPYCERRCRMLYWHWHDFKCRLCANLNYDSQQVTKGCDAAIHKINTILKSKFGMTRTLFPMEVMDYYPERPCGMHWYTYDNLLQEISRLKEEYARGFYKKMSYWFKGWR